MYYTCICGLRMAPIPSEDGRKPSRGDVRFRIVIVIIMFIIIMLVL